MLDNLTPQQFLYGDGTTQSQRPSDALAPGYAVPDARSTTDLLVLAQKYARFIGFYGENNYPQGTWEAFLPGKPLGGADAPDPAKSQWLSDLAAYLRDPHSAAHQPELQQRLSRPHLVLFISFLQLLEPVRQQLNGFTGRHLDYYFRQVLGMSTGKLVPDQVHVIVSLAEDVDQLFLEQGTPLLAGKDSRGKDLVYRVQKSTGISRARLERSARLFADKASLTIQTTREAAAADLDAGFQRMMQFAHGFLRPGETYPPELVDLNTASPAYLQDNLFISLPDGALLRELQSDSKTGRSTSPHWEKAYFILEQAFKDKTVFDRQQALKAFRESAEKPVYANLLRYAFGQLSLPPQLAPAPGSAAGASTGLDGEELQALAKEYLTERELKLMPQTDWTASRASEENWRQVYVALERAARKYGNLPLPVPVREVWRNVYASNDAWGNAANSAAFARLCFAVASPQLAMAEGTRELTITCAFRQDETSSISSIKEALTAQPKAITWALSSQKRWFEVEPTRRPDFGDFVVGSAQQAYPFAVLNGVATKNDKARFTTEDIGKYLVTEDGAIYLITANPAPTTKASVTARGNTRGQHTAGLYGPAQVYLNAMQVNFVRQPTDPPVEAPGVIDSQWPIQGNAPMLALQLNQTLPETSRHHNPDAEGIYQLFRNLKLERVKVEVAVTGIRTLRLLNDYGAVNAKKPFEPFGPSPQPGTSLYVAHPELSAKQLHSLTLTPEWMNAPTDFRAYYENYWKIRAQSLAPKPADIGITDNTAFKATLKVIDQQVQLLEKEVTLFQPLPGAGWKVNLPAKMERRPSQDVDETDPTEWSRYLQLELKNPDFQHTAHSTLLVQQAFLQWDNQKELRQLPLNPPYTPMLKTLTAGYTASFEIEQGGGGPAAQDQVLHLGTFGYKAVSLADNTRFLPSPEQRSELLLGLRAVDTPQILPIFFQLADATAQPDLTPGPIAWSYLAGNEWQPLSEAAVVSDTTNGLLNSGIIELQLPIGPTSENTWLPRGLYWLKAGFEARIDAIPDIVDVQAQGVSAAFDDRDNAPDHLLTPLAPGSITRPLADIPAIARLQQPFSSSKGRPAETTPVFYNRVSERVRHKNRALTPWDYERIVLEGFPEIYKAKCLPGDARTPGSVDLIVIPDIRGKMPAVAAEPRASAALLHQIRQFVERRVPAYAAVRVRNPAYLRVKVRAAIKIRPGYGEAHSVQQLDAELKRYLAPWAYEEGIDILVGGKLYPDMIVDFLARKSYVEFAASVVLFLSEDGQNYVPLVRLVDGSEDRARTLRPDCILVSAQEHIFDIIRESQFEERLLTGVGYAKMGLDFAIG